MENITSISNINTLLSKKPDPVTLFAGLHAEGLEKFAQMGVPEKKSERFKYTHIAPFFDWPYLQSLEAGNFQFNINEVFSCDVPHLNADVVLIINGFYYRKNTINGVLPGNIWIGSMAKAAAEKPEILSQYLGKLSTYDDGLIALNAAMFRDGFFIHVPKNTQLEKPLQIINILLSDADLMLHQRNLVVLDENSSANIMVCDHTLSAGNFFTNSVTEVFVANGARFDCTSMQNEHDQSVKVTSMFIHQGSNSYCSTNAITLHGGLVRNNTRVTLNGEGAENNTSGLFLTDKQQHVDNFVFIEHAKPNCVSNQLFKGILDNTSTGSFNGRILVARDAQKTAAYQRNNNLLLTPDAKMSTRPQLEIYADDVKCSHGATVGQLDLEAMFYMRTRGIGADEARMLLMFAFAHEIIDLIQVKPLKERIDEMVNKRLRGELTRCHNCALHCC